MYHLLTFCLSFSIIHSFKFAVFTDIHLVLNYNPYSSKKSCVDTDLTPTKDAYAPLGRQGCDIPLLMLQRALQDLKDKNGDIDVLLVPGDMIGHKISLDNSSNNGNYTLLKLTHQTIASTIQSYFPNTIVLPTLGNNDCMYHYQAPDAYNKEQFYQFFYDTWFGITGNKNLNLDQVKSTFQTGGYYRVDLSSKLSILSLNSLYYNQQNEVYLDGQDADNQMDWIQSQFTSANPDQKFVLLYHIYPGVKYGKDLWFANYTQTFFELLLKHKDQIVLEISGHDHLADFRYHSSNLPFSSKLSSSKASDEITYFHNIWIAPALSAISFTNPGYSLVFIDSNSLIPTNVEAIFFDIQSAQNTNGQGLVSQVFLNYGVLYNLKDLTALSLHNFKTTLTNDQNLTLNYLSQKTGWPISEQNESMQQVYVKQFGLLKKGLNSFNNFYCLLSKNLISSEYNNCTGSSSKFSIETLLRQSITKKL